jgi:TonB-linked SusC/RagA family outer membrane protein
MRNSPSPGLKAFSAFVCYLVFCSSFASAQTVTVSGTVKSSLDNLPLSGVSIQVIGTLNTTATDAKGNYVLSNLRSDDSLSFTYIGFRGDTVAINGRSEVDLVLESNSTSLDQVMVVGYGTRKKSDLTGAITQVDANAFKYQSTSQFTEMLAGTVAGFNANQGTSAQGGTSIEIRGPTSLSAGNNPLIVVDGAIFYGSVLDINANDIETINVLKDASSAAIFGAKAASGVIIITTKKGRKGKPTINISSKLGVTESYNERRGLNAGQYIKFRQDFFRQMSPATNYNFYTNPEELPNDMTIDQWRALSSSAPLADNMKEWMARMRFFPIEQENYLNGRTMDMYDEVFRKGIRQEYDISTSGGTDVTSYYWSLGYDNNEGIRVGDKYSSVRSRLNVDFKITDWLNVGLNTQFSDRNEGSVPASMGFYVNSPYGQMFDEEGNLERYPHGHSDNPLLDHYRRSVIDKTNSLFANLFAEVKLPLGFKFKVSFQPFYQTYKYMSFTTISEKLGGVVNELPSGTRSESSTMNWMIDNLLTWNKKFGEHDFDLTLLANIEENRFWSTSMSNKNFTPSQQLGFNGLQFGNSPEITNNDSKSTGDALMARLNYSLSGKYLLTASIRQDGYSAFGLENPRAVFPAFAVGWIISNEKFFNVSLINRLKLRASWGSNGNRDIGIYSALARTSSNLWYDGTAVRVGVFNSTLANSQLSWEKTTSLNIGLDIALLDNKIDLTAEVYDMNTTDLLMNRILPQITGFSNITTNLGKVGNRGFEMTLNTKNISNGSFSWKSSFVFSLNRNKIKNLFGDIGDYTLLGEKRNGEVPDFTNKWFPGQAVDAVWDYDLTGVWQQKEAAEAARYNMQPGDFKAVDVNNDGKYVDVEDKQFIGYTVPRHRLGLRNDFTFLKNFTASVFVRAELGHVGSYNVALNSGFESNDRWNRNNGPVPYWTADNPNTEYARLNVNTGAYGGGLMVYKPRSYMRIQDVSLAYNVPASVINRIRLNNLQFYGSIRNLATFTKWPGWDPESGMNPMPRTFTIGLNCSL